jgi:hypothetical protein
MITITPIHYNLTAEDEFQRLKTCGLPSHHLE